MHLSSFHSNLLTSIDSNLMNNECQAMSQTGNNEPQLAAAFRFGRHIPSTYAIAAERTTYYYLLPKTRLFSYSKITALRDDILTREVPVLFRQCCSSVDPCRVAPCCLIVAPKTTKGKHREKEALHGRSIAFAFTIGKRISIKKPKQ